MGMNLAGLCDAAEEDIFRRGLAKAGLGSSKTRTDMKRMGFFVCVDDLESELIRAVGSAQVEEIFDAQGDLDSFRTLQKHSAGRVQNSASQIKRFLDEVSIGDRVVTYDRDRRLYLLGEITSSPQWRPDDLPETPRVRQVKWTEKVLRDQLSQSTKNTLGAIQTLFLLKKRAADEILQKAVPIEQSESTTNPTPPSSNNDTDEEALEQLVEKSEETIEERIVRLDWEQAQSLVAGILRAMGYRTVVSPRGADRGVDIFASPDGLGLEEPRIFAEVKHRPSTSIGSQDIRSFIGGRNAGDSVSM